MSDKILGLDVSHWQDDNSTLQQMDFGRTEPAASPTHFNGGDKAGFSNLPNT